MQLERSAQSLPFGEGSLGRRRFDHLHIELSVALGVAIPRFDLWMELQEHDIDPEHLSREQAMTFCDGPLELFLHRSGLSLSPRSRRRLSRKIDRYDPTLPTPYERFAALS
jgi:hypothetical protein